MSDARRGYRGRLWLGEFPLGQRTILLSAEQGLGDTIQFVRYAPLLARAGAKVALEVQPELKTLLVGVDGVSSCHARGETLPAYDVYCPLGSLPLAFKTEPSTIPADIPYLRADDAHVAKWRPAIEALPGKRVALAWAGHARHPNDRNRSIDLKLLEPLLGIEGVSFISIQRELRDDDAALLARHANVTHLGAGLADMADTAAVTAIDRSDHRGRYIGGSSRRRHGTRRVGLAALLAGLAMDTHRHAQPLVSAGAAVSSARARRLAKRDCCNARCAAAHRQSGMIRPIRPRRG